MTKIGVFDSGLGGLTVLAEIRLALPNADLIYIADSAHAPYGEKTQAEIISLSDQIVKQLVAKKVNLIVIACNTATSAAGPTLRAQYNLPIIGMEPALKPAAEQTASGKIVVLATNYTLSHHKYLELVKRVAKNKSVVSIGAPQLVKLVEQGKTSGTKIESCFKELFRSIDNIESVVLGCTHFLHLKPALSKFLGSKVKLFDGNSGVVRRIIELLPDANSGMSTTKIVSTGSNKELFMAQQMFKQYLNFSRHKTSVFQNQVTKRRLVDEHN